MGVLVFRRVGGSMRKKLRRPDHKAEEGIVKNLCRGIFGLRVVENFDDVSKAPNANAAVTDCKTVL